MEISLSPRTIRAIAERVVLLLQRQTEKKEAEQAMNNPEMVSTKEAASILKVTPRTLRRNAWRYPHIKGQSGRLLFIKSQLLEKY